MGIVIAVEGHDSRQKVELINILCINLNIMGINTTILTFPNSDTPWGRQIKKLMNKAYLNTDNFYLHLLFALEHRKAASLIREKSQEFDVILINRSAYSFIAYAMAVGLENDLIKRMIDGSYFPSSGIYIETTGTYNTDKYLNSEELRKVHQRADLYYTNITTKNDWIVVNDTDDDTIKLLTKEIYSDILNGRLQRVAV